ncbi:gustatory receptor 68a-like [Cotesia typhae]|uniref:gustatory receptor 68a-like n=1 Tax=Cotesia typhae TaxID=2053667 RepID=UPI003D687FEC
MAISGSLDRHFLSVMSLLLIKRTKNLICKAHSAKGRIKYKLDQFSTEILHQGVLFTLVGEVSLDNHLLFSIFKTVTTYMFLFFLFEDKTKT